MGSEVVSQLRLRKIFWQRRRRVPERVVEATDLDSEEEG